MAANTRHVVNMANSIVGVSILSMPFCFREAGLVLGVLLVLLSGVITKKTCMFLIRSAIMARRRSYEFLAFHVFGVSGKLFVELCMILFLIGICISFHVVMGDLAPAIVARAMTLDNSPSLRCTLLIGIAILVVLPLCLLRKLDSLASMSAFSILFYFFLVTVIFMHAMPKLMDGSWYQLAELWRPSGALQVLPICMLGLSCQSNVFEIYDSLPDPDVPKMRSVVNHALNLCQALYITVGFFGYVAFIDQDVSGNLIMNFPPSQLTEGMKVFFTVSLAISFPLIIFPCRTSINSLLYRRSNPSSYDLVGNYMPESRFKGITLAILTVSLIIGILIPNIEFVLGLLGSTMGVLISLILPSLLFIRVNSKASAERFLAQGIMLLGVVLIVLGTYLNLAHIHQVQVDQINAAPNLPEVPRNPPVPQDLANLPQQLIKDENVPKPPKVQDKGDVVKKAESVAGGDSVTRREPVAPEPPPDDKVPPARLQEKDAAGRGEAKESVVEEGKRESKGEDRKETLHPDAIKKEEKVRGEEGGEQKKDEDDESKKVEEVDKKQAELLEKIEVQHKEQQQILAEQKQILQELKDQKAKQELEQKRQEEESKLAAAVAAQQAVPGDVAAKDVVREGNAADKIAQRPVAPGNIPAGNIVAGNVGVGGVVGGEGKAGLESLGVGGNVRMLNSADVVAPNPHVNSLAPVPPSPPQVLVANNVPAPGPVDSNVAVPAPVAPNPAAANVPQPGVAAPNVLQTGAAVQNVPHPGIAASNALQSGVAAPVQNVPQSDVAAPVQNVLQPGAAAPVQNVLQPGAAAPVQNVLQPGAAAPSVLQPAAGIPNVLQAGAAVPNVPQFSDAVLNQAILAVGIPNPGGAGAAVDAAGNPLVLMAAGANSVVAGAGVVAQLNKMEPQAAAAAGVGAPVAAAPVPGVGAPVAAAAAPVPGVGAPVAAAPVSGATGGGGVVRHQEAVQPSPRNVLPNYPGARQVGAVNYPPAVQTQDRKAELGQARPVPSEVKQPVQGQLESRGAAVGQSQARKDTVGQVDAGQGKAGQSDTLRESKNHAEAAPAKSDHRNQINDDPKRLQVDKEQPEGQRKTKHDEERRKREASDDLDLPESNSKKNVVAQVDQQFANAPNNNQQNVEALKSDSVEMVPKAVVPKVESLRVDIDKIEPPNVEFPDADLLKVEGPKAEVQDVAYDTRHLLWTGRSRRKRRRNDRNRDDYYWDET